MKLHLYQLVKYSGYQELGVIAVTHLLYGLPYPRNPPYAQAHTGMDIRLTGQLKNYGNEDLTIKGENDEPLEIIYYIMAAAATSTEPNT